MTRTTILIPAAEIPQWLALGYRLRYRCPGGWRWDCEAASMERVRA